MKAIIKLDIPEYQIGQEVSIYFKDTMMIKGVVQKPKHDIGMYERENTNWSGAQGNTIDRIKKEYENERGHWGIYG